MIKYRIMIVFFIIGVLLIGSGAIYTILFAMGTDVQEEVSDKTKTSVKKTQQDVSETYVNEQIESLISGYLNAKLADDISAINTYVNDSEFIDEKKILKQNQYVESYSNIKCIIKECKKKDTYRVYAYYDMKLFDIEQQLPSLASYYVIRQDGDYKIFLGKIGSSLQKQIQNMDKSEEIVLLKDSVQKRMKDIIAKDEQVRLFLEGLKSAGY